MLARRLKPVFLLFSTLLMAFALNVRAADFIPAPPDVAARAYLVMDAQTGKVLFGENIDERFAPASLTKMMTAYIVEHEVDKGDISEDDLVPISEKAWRTQGSRMFVREGTRVKLDDLMHGMVIQSGNDATVALAEYIGGSEGAFVDLMNQYAKRFGLKNTHFADATGLPHDDHYSSAHDLAIIARHLIRDFPDHYKLYSEKYFTYNNIRQPNRNRLLWRDSSVDGIKTGHTDDAGFCLVSSAKQDGMRLISVVLGTKTDEARARESQKILNYSFRFYRTHQLYKADQVLQNVRVWGGKSDDLALGVAKDLAVVIPRGQDSKLKATLDIDGIIKAPVQKGQQVGTVRVTLDGNEIETAPVVAQQSIEKGGFFKRIWDQILLFFHNLF